MKKVCVVTATRAEYGLLRPLLNRIKDSKRIGLQLIVTGTHLEEKYGQTIQEIINDGFKPDICAQIIVDDTPQGILDTMANATKEVGKALITLMPDMLVLLGDRYEIVSIAAASVALGIPIAHLHGGELTYGAYDELYRHAITKMSYLHFTATEEYRKRVIQMGESADRVYNFGALGIENVLDMQLLSKKELEEQIDFCMDNTLLATFHPVTMESTSQKSQFEELLNALAESKFNVLFTRPNTDTNSSELNSMLDNYTTQANGKVKVLDSMGVLKYLSAMKYCAGVVGNSSSGIIEAPSMHVGTINIGNRQKGRISASSVIHCVAEKNEIIKALDILETEKFQIRLRTTSNPYEGKYTSKNILAKIEQCIENGCKPKEFYDL